MITLGMLWMCGSLVAQASAEQDATRALEAALAAAGVFARAADAPAQEEHLRVAGFTDVGWRTPAAGYAFVVVPGAEPYFGEHGERAVSWSEHVAPLTWGGEQVRLSLTQVGSSGTATGRLHLPRPTPDGNAAAETLPTRIETLSSGCPMTHRFELPLEFGPQGVDLDFEWDLHTPVLLANRRLTLQLDHGVVASVPIELAVERPALALDRPRLVFAPQPAGRADVSITLREHAEGRLHHVVHPACIALVEIAERASGWTLTFEDTPIADSYHTCNAERVDVAIDGDPQPYSRFVGVRHTGAVLDVRGARMLCGVFAPGERVEVWSNGQRVKLGHFDRLPCARELLGAFGFTRAAVFDVPAGQGNLDLPLGDSNAYRVLGSRLDEVVAAMSAWGEACAH